MGARSMSHEEHADGRKHAGPGSRQRSASRRPAGPPRTGAEEFITKEDLSQFLSIKPYLSDKAQSVVDLLAEVQKTGGRLDANSLGRLLALAGGNAGLAALTSALSGMSGGGGKLDANALVPLLGMLNQVAGQGKGNADS